ncbi:hypothetical protein [Roseinatronobacter sp. NSM]|uniref:hypothetical protein n=1 Tax=Roseinatronobacter sp. NSM TaxID=3457785 RepID=UPI00403603AC
MFDWDKDYDDLVVIGGQVAATTDGVLAQDNAWLGRFARLCAIFCLAVISFYPSHTETASGQVVSFAAPGTHRNDMPLPEGLQTYTVVETQTFLNGIAALGNADLRAYASITAQDLDHAAGTRTAGFFQDAMIMIEFEMARRGMAAHPSPAF